VANDKKFNLYIEAIFESKRFQEEVAKSVKSLQKLNKEKDKSIINNRSEAKSVDDLVNYLKKITKERDKSTDPKNTKELNKEIKKTGEEIEKLTGKTKESSSIFSKFTTGAIAGIAAVAGTVNFLASSYMEFAKAQKEGVLLNQAFAQNMGAKEASEATTAFNDFASAISEVTVYEDDAIIAAGRLMEAITGVSEQGLERATMAAMDFASATGGNLKEAMEAMSMASEGSRNMFKKYGIEVDETATKAEKLEQITKGLQDRFGGFAEKEGKTIVGQLKILENQYGNLKEQIGEFLAFNVLTAGGEKGILSSIVSGASDGIKLVEGAFVLWGVWMTNFGIKLGANFDALGDMITGTFQRISQMAKIVSTQVKAMISGKDAGKELGLMFDKYDSYVAKVKEGGQVLKAIYSGNNKALKELGITLVSETDALANYQADKEKAMTALHEKENKKRGKSKNQLTDEQIKAAEKLNEKQIQVLNDWLAMSQSGLEKELAQLDAKYKKDIQEAQLTGAKKVEIDKLYTAAREEIMKASFANYVADKQIQLDSENKLYEDLLKNFQGTEEEKERIRKKHAENIQKINAQMTEGEKIGFDSLMKIANALGNLIPGEAGKAVKGILDFTQALIESGGDPIKIATASIVALIGAIATEMEKANKAMEMSQANSMATMTDVWKAGIDEQIRVLEGRQARDRALMDERHAWEMEEFENNSAAAVALKAMKDQEAADAYAAMTAEEQAKYDIQKKYDDERKALEEKQAAEKEDLEKQQKAARNDAKAKQFDANKKIQMAQTRIDWSKAESEVHKTFWAPWDEDKRNDLLGQLSDRYSSILSLIGGQQFIPEYARGTNSARSGIGLVGERGPELMNFGGGEQVISNSDLVGAMVQGLNLNRMVGSQTRNSYTTNSSNQSFAGANFNLHGVQDPRSLLLAIQKEANSMGSSILR